MRVLLIDYGLGNLGSARRALEECGADVVASEDPADLAKVERFVLPGVGAFGDGMSNLRERGWEAGMKDALKNPGVSMLGICLGMQLLADRGYESGEIDGLGLIGGEVRRLVPDSPNTRIPHVGWNEVHHRSMDPLFDRIPNGSDFYFVHSYHFMAAAEEHVVASTPYCNQFVSAVRCGNVAGVQFHPEKSARPGLQLLRNFLVHEPC